MLQATFLEPPLLYFSLSREWLQRRQQRKKTCILEPFMDKICIDRLATRDLCSRNARHRHLIIKLILFIIQPKSLFKSAHKVPHSVHYRWWILRLLLVMPVGPVQRAPTVPPITQAGSLLAIIAGFFLRRRCCLTVELDQNVAHPAPHLCQSAACHKKALTDDEPCHHP